MTDPECYYEKKPNGLDARCGPECQTTHFPPSGHWSTPSSFYPNEPKNPGHCSVPPNRWLDMSTPESIKNLTVQKNGKNYICNQSCPPPDVACGLEEGSVPNGVMDSIQIAGLASGMSKLDLPMYNMIWTGDDVKEKFTNDYNMYDHQGTRGYYCCDNKKVKKKGAFPADTWTSGECKKAGGYPSTDSINCLTGNRPKIPTRS